MKEIIMKSTVVLLLLQLTSAVKIGISKVNIDTTSTTTTTTTTAANFTETATEYTTGITAITDTTEFEVESSSPTTATTMKTTTTQIKPNFTLSIFPPRLKTTKMPKITTTSTSTPPTTTTATTTLSPIENSTALANVLSTKPISGSYYCSCDLMVDACDTNCCCDRDCIPEALHVFNCNSAAMHHIELKNRLEDFQYQHGLPSCKVNDGWLCVFRTNIQREQLKEPKIDWDLRQYYKWTAPTWEAATDLKSNEDIVYYKNGEALQFLNAKTMILSQLDLPHTFKPPHCQIKQTVKFLKSYETNCLLGSIEELQSNARSLLKFIQNYQILFKPLRQASELEHITPMSRDFQLKICQNQFCTPVPLDNTTTIDLRLKAHYVTEIKLVLLHNYTQLLGGMGMVELRNSSYPPLNSTELWQHFQVKFIYRNVTVNDVNTKINETAFEQENENALTSGPLGYLIGEPIIIARFIAFNESDDSTPTNEVLDYFHENSTKSRLNHTLTLFTTHQGKCVHDANGKNVINYGISTLKQCKLRYSELSVSKLPQNERNYTEICMKLQTEITTKFFGAINFFDTKSPDIFISQLGRPANVRAKWTPLHIQRRNDFLSITGVYNAQTRSFSCRNMLINIAYEFLVGHFEENGIKHQALVKQATLIFGERNDLEFDMDEVIEVPLMITVMFFDYAKDVTNAGSSRCIETFIWTILLLKFCSFICKQYFMN